MCAKNVATKCFDYRCRRVFKSLQNKVAKSCSTRWLRANWTAKHANADAATALPAFVSTPPFEFPCEYANARALNALDKPGDYDTKQFKNDGAVGDAQDPGQTMANIGSGQAAANIVAGTAKESDRYAAYKQWAAYNKTQMQDIKTIAGLLSKHVSLQAHRAQAFAVIKAVPFVRVNCPP